jgi:Holliday junction resolvasome RuvABC endonuclease subunit
MKILGIDQSYTGCAYVVMENGIMTDFGIVRTPKTDDMFTRARNTALQICDVYAQHKPDTTQLEGLAFGMIGNATRDLAGLLFTIVNVLTLKNPTFTYTLLSPTTVKKSATGSGKAKKADMIDALPADIREKFAAKGFKKTTGMADLADAFWIASYNK